MPFFELGEVRLPTDDDFEYFKSMVLDTSQWKKHHSKKKVQVFTRSTSVSSFKMIKNSVTFGNQVIASLPDVSADVMYDTLHDSIYRGSWDKTMKEGHEICRISPNSVIDYHASNLHLFPFNPVFPSFLSQSPFRVCQPRLCDESYMANFRRRVYYSQSLRVSQTPPKKEYIRGICFLTGYLIRRTGPRSCDFYYITQNDPRGIIPAWAINLGTKSLAPSIMRSLHRAALNYPAWKDQHDPDFMPWRYTNQQSGLSPPLDMNDILKEPDFCRTEIDESNVSEAAALKEVAAEQTNDSGDDMLNDE
ncbi:hypothetical protein T265_10708 [Opisthorchis viverrini]|uniref:START domain-containing protein n=1 Tax=Opisthorchis viverrini TaxID=6198 RepID=A0A075A090_OPIVI|nr:hypothetical protein T265_10708 [Opisthorchis viverrini]KER20834.1 hypothetical protein T265_10708 [Opisthorchis viverrini]